MSSLPFNFLSSSSSYTVIVCHHFFLSQRTCSSPLTSPSTTLCVLSLCVSSPRSFLFSATTTTFHNCLLTFVFSCVSSFSLSIISLCLSFPTLLSFLCPFFYHSLPQTTSSSSSSTSPFVPLLSPPPYFMPPSLPPSLSPGPWEFHPSHYRLINMDV